MAKDNLRQYSSTAASNTDVGGVNLSEGVMVPSDINNSIREVMSHLADFSAGTEGIDVLSLEDDDASAAIKFQAPATVTTTTTFTLPDGDGSSGQVLSTNGSGTLSWASQASSPVVSGVLVPYAGTSAPSGWLLCYGQAVSRTTYADLFSAISTTYGSGDGSTTFNLPDLRGRVIAGQDDMGGTSANRLTDQSGGLNGDTLGDTGGSETHTLTTSEMPAHTHDVSGTVSSVGTAGAASGAQTFVNAVNTTTGTSTSTGGGGAHNNVQPTIILNYIIKT